MASIVFAVYFSSDQDRSTALDSVMKAIRPLIEEESEIEKIKHNLNPEQEPSKHER